MQSTLALPTTKQGNKVPMINKRQSQSGSLAYGVISDKSKDHVNDYKKMQNIRVIARFRPKNKREVRWSKLNNVIDKPPLYISSQVVSLDPYSTTSSSDNSSSSYYGRMNSSSSMDFSNVNASSSSSSTQRQFQCTLDAILNQQCTQKQVFYRCGLPMIMACLSGYNGTIFAYGQSGSGKTYTMMGPENNVKSADEFGLVPRCIIYLFQKLDEKLSQNGGKLQDYIVNMELLQIYKSQLLDLLNPKSKKKLVIKTNFSTDSVFVQNLKSVQIQTVEEAFKLLTNAQENRIVAGHSLNEVSSRSHMLITMTVVQRSIDGTLKTSKLNFGDLAGSEDLTKALGRNDDQERKKEAIAINQSLSALTTAVSYLSRGQKPGFRDSPLTHILKDSLGGNSKTIMLVTVSPHIYNRTETIRTLRFASTAKKIKNKAKINEEKSIIALKKRIKELERENVKLRQDLVAKTNITKKIKESKKKDKGKDKDKDKDNNNGKNKDKYIEVKENDDDQSSVILHTDEDDMESDQKTMEKNTKKRKASVASSSGSIDDENGINEDDDEWGSDSEGDDMVNHLEDNAKNGDNSDDSEDESNFELHEYINQLNEYREKLDRECEENETLQLKVDEKNLELESCANKIAELVDELNQNEQDFYDSKAKINHLQSVIAQYRQQFPSFKPEISNNGNNTDLASQSPSPLPRRSTISSSLTIGSNQALLPMPDDYDIVPDLMLQNSFSSTSGGHGLLPRPSLSRQDTFMHQTNLLQNLLTLHQRMESKMMATESALNELRESQHQQPLRLMPRSSLQPITSNHSITTNELNQMRLTQMNSNHSNISHRTSNSNICKMKQLDVVNDNASSTLIYESADEKLSEWDLDVSTGRDSEITDITNNNKSKSKTKSKMKSKQKVNDDEEDEEDEEDEDQDENVEDDEQSPSPPIDVDKIKNSKQLRQHLQTLSKNEKKLKRDLAEKLKAEAKASSTWCQCWFTKPKKNDSMTGNLIEEYLKMKVRKELVKDKYQRKKEKNRKKRMKNNGSKPGKPVITNQ